MVHHHPNGTFFTPDQRAAATARRAERNRRIEEAERVIHPKVLEAINIFKGGLQDKIDELQDRSTKGKRRGRGDERGELLSAPAPGGPDQDVRVWAPRLAP